MAFVATQGILVDSSLADEDIDIEDVEVLEEDIVVLNTDNILYVKPTHESNPFHIVGYRFVTLLSNNDMFFTKHFILRKFLDEKEEDPEES